MTTGRQQRRPLTAFDVACRWLGHAPRSQVEVRARLTRLGFSEGAVVDALRRLCELGFIDDRDLASTRAQTLAARGYGDAWIEHDLVRRGLDGQVANSALAGLPSEEDRARAWVAERGGDRAAGTARRTLLRRGFTPESVDGVLGPDEEGASVD